MPPVNKLMGIGTPGFTHGFPALSDLWRWRFIHYAHREQTPPPRDSTLRVSRHPNASFHFGCAIRAMTAAGDAVRIETASGKRFETDFVILGTGFTVDPRARPELAGFADKIATWADRFTPPADLASEELAHFPYLAPDFSFTEREPGTAPWLKDIHCFNYAATLSLGKISGDIPAISEGAALAGALHRRRVLCRGRRAALRGPAGVRKAGAPWRRMDRRRGAQPDSRLKPRRPGEALMAANKWR